MVSYSRNSGMSLHDAVVITGAETHFESVMAEHKYIKNVLLKENVEFHIEEQNILHAGGRHYDVVKIALTNGEKKTVFFDITEPYNKFVVYPQ